MAAIGMLHFAGNGMSQSKPSFGVVIVERSLRLWLVGVQHDIQEEFLRTAKPQGVSPGHCGCGEQAFGTFPEQQRPKNNSISTFWCLDKRET